MNRDTIEVALDTVNAKRARLRRQVAAGFRSTDTTREELELLDTAYDELAVELAILKAAQAPPATIRRAGVISLTGDGNAEVIERPLVDPHYPAGGRVPVTMHYPDGDQAVTVHFDPADTLDAARAQGYAQGLADGAKRPRR